MGRQTSRTCLGAIVLAPLLVLAACSAADDSPAEGEPAPVPAPDATAGDTGAPQDTGDGGDAGDNGDAGDAGDDGGADSPAATDGTDGTDGTGAERAGGDGPLEITVAASGDVLAHTWVNISARNYAGNPDRSLQPIPGDSYDYSPMFADIADLVSGADLSICHLETPLSPDNTNLSIPNTLSFNTPREMADALADAGYDGCDFASNHTMDRGIQGVADTEQVLREAGMGYAGPTADEDRAGLPEVYEVQPDEGGGTARVAHLAYTYTYPNSGTPTTTIPGEAPWLVDAHWPNLGSEGILEQAEAAKEDGADFVVVSMHWGKEYQAQPTGDQRQLAQDLLGSDAVDLILGTHVHVIQPCEEINGKHVIYGLGNSLSNQSPQTAASLLPETQDGMVAVFTLSRDEDGTVSTQMAYQPTRVEIPPDIAPGHLIRLVSPENHPESWARTTAAVDLLGGCGAEPVDPSTRG